MNVSLSRHFDIKFGALIFWMVSLVIVAAVSILVFSQAGHVRYGPELQRSYRHGLRIAGAISEYEHANGCYPPREVSINGHRHSWRVLILPFLGYESLYDAYRFDEPWDGPTNLRLLSAMPVEYGDSSIGNTRFLAVSGDCSMWPVAGNRFEEDVADGTFQTMVFFESNSLVPWLAPYDLEAESLVVEDVLLHNSGRIVVGYADGSAEVHEGITTKQLKELICIDDET